ncbi:hypothetical protein H312_00615, partial [Anncaliia algerae PRA339]
ILILNHRIYFVSTILLTIFSYIFHKLSISFKVFHSLNLFFCILSDFVRTIGLCIALSGNNSISFDIIYFYNINIIPYMREWCISSSIIYMSYNIFTLTLTEDVKIINTFLVIYLFCNLVAINFFNYFQFFFDYIWVFLGIILSSICYHIKNKNLLERKIKVNSYIYCDILNLFFIVSIYFNLYIILSDKSKLVDYITTLKN